MVAPWLILGVLFALPFVDPHRPLRLLHLDLLVLLLVGVGPHLAGDGPFSSYVPTVLGLSYLAARLLSSGFRPTARRGPLVPVLPVRWLAVGVALVLLLRLSYALGPQQLVGDVGLGSVAGADRIGKGEELYDGDLDPALPPHTDTYGPLTYLAYVPFEQAFPWGGGYGGAAYDDPDAGHVAAFTFDLLLVLCLVAFGRRLRPGPDGRLLGVALAYAWASYPYAFFQVYYGSHDTLVALLVVAAFLMLPYAAGRGAFAALAATAKFAPAILAPLLATGTGERRGRSWLLFSAAFVVVLLVVLVPFLPPGGLEAFWDRTLGYQQDRPGWNSLWTRFSDLDWLQRVTQVGVVGLALFVAMVPRRRSPLQLAALGGGLMAALQLTVTYWFSSYVLWFAPLAFAAFFAAHELRRERVRS